MIPTGLEHYIAICLRIPKRNHPLWMLPSAGRRTNVWCGRGTWLGRRCNAIFAPKKCTAFVLPTSDLAGFPRFLLKIRDIIKNRVNTGFPCIFDNFEYDCFGGRNLREWFESYLRSQSFPDTY